jgi:hypothetical protein
VDHRELNLGCFPFRVWLLPQVIIQDGQVLAGTLCKKTLGAAPGGLVHVTWMEYGPEAARAVLSQARGGTALSCLPVTQWAPVRPCQLMCYCMATGCPFHR